MFDLGDLLGIAKDVGELFSRLKEKLLRQPDEAAAKLADVLEELAKIFVFVDGEIVRFLSVYVLPDRSNIVNCRSTLLGMEGGHLAIKGDEARGHCHKIENIYNKHLQRWFHELLTQQESADLSYLFNRLNNADDNMVRALASVTDWLTQEAHNALNAIDDGQFDDANNRVRDARSAVHQTRRDISEALRTLRALQADFIAASGTV
jgi:hypothetical protein